MKLLLSQVSFCANKARNHLHTKLCSLNIWRLLRITKDSAFDKAKHLDKGKAKAWKLKMKT